MPENLSSAVKRIQLSAKRMQKAISLDASEKIARVQKFVEGLDVPNRIADAKLKAKTRYEEIVESSAIENEIRFRDTPVDPQILLATVVSLATAVVLILATRGSGATEPESTKYEVISNFKASNSITTEDTTTYAAPAYIQIEEPVETVEEPVISMVTLEQLGLYDERFAELSPEEQEEIYKNLGTYITSSIDNLQAPPLNELPITADLSYEECCAIADSRANEWYIPVITLDYAWETFEMPYEHQRHAYILCEQQNIDYWLILSIIARESRFDWTVSNGEMIGYMQICNAAVIGMQDRLGGKQCDRWDPIENITLGIECYEDALERTNGEEYAALWSYASGYWGYLEEVAEGQTSNIHVEKAYKYRKMLTDEELNPRFVM